MKKKKIIIILSVILLILIIPIPVGILKDGGTRVYSALSYKIVCWNKMTDDGIYKKTKIYPFPLNLLPLTSLFNLENVDNTRSSYFTDVEAQQQTEPAETNDHDIGIKYEEPSVENITFSAYYVRTDGHIENTKYPKTTIISSVKELEEYYNANCNSYSLGYDYHADVHSSRRIEFLDICKKYDEEYFKEKVLILVLLEEGSGSISHKVERMELITEDNIKKVVININRLIPEAGTDDMAYWHVFIEPEKKLDIDSKDQIEIYFGKKDATENDRIITREEAMLLADIVRTIDIPPINAVFDTKNKVWYVYCHKEGEPDGMADEGHQTIMISGDGSSFLINPVFNEWTYENE